MTDGTHEPKRPDMAQKHPQGCLEAYLNDRWCAFATELDAYLVYYHLLGSADPEIQQVTDETCRAMSVEPGDGTPDRLHYISPQVQLISRDEAFLAEPQLYHTGDVFFGAFHVPIVRVYGFACRQRL